MMKRFFNKPYPFNNDLQHNAKVIFFISIGILGFLLIFQPIEISLLSKKEIFYLVSGLAASTFIILTVNLIILPSLFPGLFDNKKWTVKKEILWNIWIILGISSSFLLFFSKLSGLMDIRFVDIVKIILLGSLPVTVLIIMNQNRLLRSHLRSARQLNERLKEIKQQKDKRIRLESDYKNDDLVIKPDSLILIKSADNYVEVYYENEGGIKKQMIRSTLKKMEEIFRKFHFIVKCHRSCIVNIHYIKEIRGNSQGYTLFFEKIDFPVMVSLKYINTLKKML
ncbi:MAG: LytTR family DNA-binding domain-containing protein [Bacteroidales bacterium]